MKSSHRMLPVFGIVFIDLLGFGLVIPLIALYGKHFGASSLELAVLGSCYSFFQFLFSPVWGSLSDRLGRRPILIMSLAGSTVSYLLFAVADTYLLLLASRAFAGIFAANISTAHAYVADSTSPEQRTRSMGLVGAAVGLGFTLGPPVGGLSVKFLGMSAPGFIAAGICGLNLLLALFVLPESLPAGDRRTDRRSALSNISGLARLRRLKETPLLLVLILGYSIAILAFSHMEQAFSLFLQDRLELSTIDAGYYAGFLLLSMGGVGVLVQGLLIRPLCAKFGDWTLLFVGLFVTALGMAAFSSGTTLSELFQFALPIALGGALVNPSLSSLISKQTDGSQQGWTFGVTQSLASLARVLGPFSGLYLFGLWPPLPFIVAALLYSGVLLFCLWVFRTRVSLNPLGETA